MRCIADFTQYRCTSLVLFLFAVGLLTVAAGCSENKPRSIEEIERDRMSLPALYLTESGKEIIAAGNRGVFVDEDSGQLAWPAYTCKNPDCPGEPQNGRDAFVFTWPDPRFYVAQDGTLGSRVFPNAGDWLEALKEMGGNEVATCPACFKTRNIGKESRAEIEKYRLWVEKYELPGTDERLAELAAEQQEREAYILRRVMGE